MIITGDGRRGCLNGAALGQSVTSAAGEDNGFVTFAFLIVLEFATAVALHYGVAAAT